MTDIYLGRRPARGEHLKEYVRYLSYILCNAKVTTCPGSQRHLHRSFVARFDFDDFGPSIIGTYSFSDMRGDFNLGKVPLHIFYSEAARYIDKRTQMKPNLQSASWAVEVISQ